MVSLLIKLKHRFPGLWNFTESANGILFSKLYKNLDKITSDVLASYGNNNFLYSRIVKDDIDELIAFRKRQNNDYLVYFDPHSFDKKTFDRLLTNTSYSLMKITDATTGRIVGYFFIRCFFIGKAFHGLITDEAFVNRGLGTSMWKISMEICSRLGIRMFATISKNNIPSLKSASNATKIRIVDRLERDFLLIECCPKRIS